MPQSSQPVSRSLTSEDISLTVFPAYFFPTDSSMNHWELVVEGLLTRPGKEGFRSRWSVSMLAAVMGLSRQELETPIFHQRSAPFLAQGVKRKGIVLKVGQDLFPLARRTNAAGILRGRIELTLKQICGAVGINTKDLSKAKKQLISSQHAVPLEVIPQGVEAKSVNLEAKLIPPSGLSIVSDIDDTIKDTQVAPLRALLTNTFLKKFKSIQGMSAVYQNWEKDGAAFHYVSSSPWQLFNPLIQLCKDDEFPCGTFHLRAFRLGRDLAQKMLIFRRRGKFVVIRSLLKRLPNRKFVLIGDSGEKDPEIYAKLAAKFPDQVIGIFIRKIDHRPLSEKRLQKLTAKSKSVPCIGFDSADQLKKLVDQVLVKGKTSPGAG